MSNSGSSNNSPAHQANSLANKMTKLNVNATEFVPSWTMPPAASAENSQNNSGKF